MHIGIVATIALAIILVVVGFIIIQITAGKIIEPGGVASDQELISLCQEWANPPQECNPAAYGTIGGGRLAEICEERYKTMKDGPKTICEKICRNRCILILPSE